MDGETRKCLEDLERANRELRAAQERTHSSVESLKETKKWVMTFFAVLAVMGVSVAGYVQRVQNEVREVGAVAATAVAAADSARGTATVALANAMDARDRLHGFVVDTAGPALQVVFDGLSEKARQDTRRARDQLDTFVSDTAQSTLQLVFDRLMDDVASQIVPQVAEALPQSLVGSVGPQGGQTSGVGFSARRIEKGRYRIDFEHPFSRIPIVVATPSQRRGPDPTPSNMGNTLLILPDAAGFDLFMSREGSPQNGPFVFEATEPTG